MLRTVACLTIASYCGVPTAAMGFEEDDWSTGSTDNRFAGLSQKSGTLFRRVREADPVAQLQHALNLESQGRLRRAGRQFNALVHRWPEADEAAAAQLALARVLQARGRYENAFREYQYLIEHYGGLFSYHAVLSEQLTVARSVMEQRRGTFGFLPGFESPERAIPLLQVIIANGPNWAEIPEVRLMIGRIHEDGADYADAVAAYEAVIINHGRHPATQEAIFRKAICLERIANRHPRDTQRTHAAMQALFAALREDLNPEQAAEVQALIAGLRDRLEQIHLDQADYYDRIARNPDAALLSYRDFVRRFPNSERQAFVMERIKKLEAMDAKQKE
ncbi:MAG: tetratricopeptide repeat protein [Kiritimatiellia bacterium]